MILSLVLTVVLSVVCNAWFVSLVLKDRRPHELGVPAPTVVHEIPDMTFDWRGLV